MLYIIIFIVFIIVSILFYYLIGRIFDISGSDRIRYIEKSKIKNKPEWLLKLSKFLVIVLNILSPLAADKNKGSTDLVAPLKIKLMQAGLVNNTHTVWLYLGIKVLLSLIFIIIGLAAISLYNNNTSFPVISLVLIIFFCAGLYFPDLLLMRLTRRRQKVIFNSFPDVLDLMRMCVQSGLGLDQSLDRVGKEIWLTCPPLSKEIELTGLELRAGVSRADSLRNLSLRIGLVDVESFVITLIQSDRFGNSVAEALTIYADSLRSKRRISAEEQAAKLSIKLMIPLIFCIFPALLVVLLGPAIVHIHNSLIPILGG